MRTRGIIEEAVFNHKMNYSPKFLPETKVITYRGKRLLIHYVTFGLDKYDIQIDDIEVDNESLYMEYYNVLDSIMETLFQELASENIQ